MRTRWRDRLNCYLGMCKSYSQECWWMCKHCGKVAQHRPGQPQAFQWKMVRPSLPAAKVDKIGPS